MKWINELKDKVLAGKSISKSDAKKLFLLEEEHSENLFKASNEIRKFFVGDKVDLCTILNAKSGACSEDCKFCAQSAHHGGNAATYDLLKYDEILEKAKQVEASGAHRFSLVTSGKSVDPIFEDVVEIYKKLRQDTSLKLCASHGTITTEQVQMLKEVGVTMYHHNVESSSEFYKDIVTTHDYKLRVDTVKAIQEAGMDVCCGGIFGLGESIDNRIEMAFEIRDLGIKSIPLNVLMPVAGTPLENNEVLSPFEILKSMAIYRFINPDAYIRYAGGRMALKDLQAKGFESGVNAALVGDFLTTIGSNVEEDKAMIVCSGLEL